MQDFEQLTAAVNAQLRKCLNDGRQPSSPSAALFDATGATALFDEVESLTFRGGKRIRAFLVQTGAALLDDDGPLQSAVLDAAAAMELLHTYFLIHDDIMDEDTTRRGGPAVHVSLARRFLDVKAGINQGILAGDLACALQESLMANLETTGTRHRLAMSLFTQMHRAVIIGQSLDLSGDASPETIVALKTASYTTVGPLLIGAALAGAEGDQLTSLKDIALPLGIAFQYRDDLLGAFGTSAVTGKSVGSDIRSGKRTFLLETARRRAGEADRAFIETRLGSADLGDDEVDRMMRILEETAARQICETTVDALTRDALSALERFEGRPAGKEMLRRLAARLVNRET